MKIKKWNNILLDEQGIPEDAKTFGKEFEACFAELIEDSIEWNLLK